MGILTKLVKSPKKPPLSAEKKEKSTAGVYAAAGEKLSPENVRHLKPIVRHKKLAVHKPTK